MADSPELPSEPRRDAAYACALIAICAVAVTHPLLVHGASCGHDFDFHLQSWLAVAADWRGGLWHPSWIAGANYGAGEPRFVFYPPASWLLGAALGVVLPWAYVPAAFTWLALFLAGCTARHAARHSMPANAATLAGCLYLANPYLLFTGFERTAYGELLAAAWIPLVLLYAVRGIRSWKALAACIAALWLTNAPAAVMGCYLAVFCALIPSRLEPREWRDALRLLWIRLWTGILAVVLGTAIAAFYVYPAWYEQRWVQIARANASGMRVQDSFLFGHTGEPFHDQVLHTASSLAMAILTAAAVGAALSFFRRTGAPAASRLRLTLLGISAAIFFLLLPVSAPLWNHLPQMHFLQFPWRWLLVAGLAASLLLALAVPPAWRLRPVALGLLLWSLGSSVWAEHQFRQVCDEEDNVEAQLQIVDAGFEGTDEYTSLAADNGEIQQGLPPVRLLRSATADEGDDSAAENPPWQPDAADTIPGQFSVKRWSPEAKDLTIVASEPGYAVLRLETYPAWRVEVNGHACAGGCLAAREDGLLTVPVGRGRTEIDLHYGTTGDVRAGQAISLTALISLLVVSRRRKPTGTAASYDEHDGSRHPV
jgi:hypothetical protein